MECWKLFLIDAIWTNLFLNIKFIRIYRGISKLNYQALTKELTNHFIQAKHKISQLTFLEQLWENISHLFRSKMLLKLRKVIFVKIKTLMIQ